MALTLIVVSPIFFTVCDTRDKDGRQKGGSDRRPDALRSDHGTVGSLHLEELDDEGRASCHNLSRQMSEGTVLNAHDGQLAAEGQLKREAVEVGVIVEVQFLQVLQCS